MAASLTLQQATNKKRAQARKLRDLGLSYKQVGLIMGVPRQRVCRWLEDQAKPNSHRHWMRKRARTQRKRPDRPYKMRNA